MKLMNCPVEGHSPRKDRSSSGTKSLGLSSVAPLTTDQKPKRVIRLPKVVEMTGMCRSSIYAWMRNGCFPASFALGPRCVGWLEEEIDQWIIDRMKARHE